MIESENISRLYYLYLEDKLPQTFLIETNNIDKCFEDVKNLLRRITCHEHHNEALKTCSTCNLITKEQYPEMVIIGKNDFDISKKDVVSLKKTVENKPVLSSLISYIIVHGERLNEFSANSLLKLLEEPYPEVVGFIIVEQQNKVLPTIKSRCQIINARYQLPSTSSDSFIEVYERHFNMIKNEKILKHDNVFPKDVSRLFLSEYYKFVLDEFLSQKNDKINIKLIKITNEVLDMIDANVNIDLCNDYFTIEARKIYDK